MCRGSALLEQGFLQWTRQITRPPSCTPLYSSQPAHFLVVQPCLAGLTSLRCLRIASTTASSGNFYAGLLLLVAFKGQHRAGGHTTVNVP